MQSIIFCLNSNIWTAYFRWTLRHQGLPTDCLAVFFGCRGMSLDYAHYCSVFSPDQLQFEGLKCLFDCRRFNCVPRMKPFISLKSKTMNYETNINYLAATHLRGRNKEMSISDVW